jgi:hypothetical protein
MPPSSSAAHCELFDHLLGTGQERQWEVRPSDLAVFRLISSSNLVGCSSGRSPGFAPLRILATYLAPRRARSGMSAP